MIPGNHLQNNWYMGKAPIIVRTISDFRERTEGFSGDFQLVDEDGNCLSLRMGSGKLICGFNKTGEKGVK